MRVIAAYNSCGPIFLSGHAILAAQFLGDLRLASIPPRCARDGGQTVTPFANLFSRSVCALLATLFFSAAITSARAQTETALHDFVSFPQGLEPSNIVVGVDGSLYFCTLSGGDHGSGAIIKLAQDKNGKWEQSVIYSFKGSTFSDGEIPVSLQLDGQGNIYGLTSWGGQIIKGQVCGECGTAFKLTQNPDGTWSEKVLYSFGLNDSDGWFPGGNFVIDAAGNIYGSTNEGGQYQDGMVFELSPTPSGQWVETVLYTFTGKHDGSFPVAGIVADATGNLYGITSYGGDLECGYENEGCGVVFQLSRTANGSWQEQVLYSFPNTSDAPSGGIAIDQSGNVYGTGGSSVFEVSPSGGNTWIFQPLHQFFNPDGNTPDFLLIDGQGNIYGTAYGGGAGMETCYYGCGTVFRLTNPGGTGWTFDLVYSFPGSRDGMDPVALAVAPSGQLYGVTQFGGQLAGTPVNDSGLPYGSGTAFSLSETSGNWSHAMLTTLSPSDGTVPTAGLISDAAGNLYGTTSASGRDSLGSIFEMQPGPNGAWTEKVIYDESSKGNLIFDPAGNLYGTTGSSILRLTPSAQGLWSSTTIYRFQLYPFIGGQGPNGVILDAAGNLYGTTSWGGIGQCYDASYSLIGCGVVFMLSENSDGTWSETILHNFAGPPYDGSAPLSSLTMGPGGELYGTTSQGGPSSCYEKGGNPPGCGAAFRLLPSGNGGWTYTILHFFEGLDGQTPTTGVTLGPDGTLYGTAPQGGQAGYGLAYKLTPSANVPWTFTALHNFGQTTLDGRNPSGSLSMDGDGNLYGVTGGGGISAAGTVFKLSPQSAGPWTETVLHNFSGSFADGSNPMGELWLDSQGDIFGTTSSGGEGYAPVLQFQNGGTVFEIVP